MDIPQKIVDLVRLEEEQGMEGGGEAFGNSVSFLKLANCPFQRICCFGDVFSDHNLANLGIIILHNDKYTFDVLGSVCH